VTSSPFSRTLDLLDRVCACRDEDWNGAFELPLIKVFESRGLLMGFGHNFDMCNTRSLQCGLVHVHI